jgi:hypothetical protein
MKQPGVYFVQRGKHGFLADQEWDGDTFCSDPWYAICRTEPWAEGRGAEYYKCVAVELSVINNGLHKDSPVINVDCYPRLKHKVKYKCKCSVCGASTKNYALPGTALATWAQIMRDQKCLQYTWKLKENKE